MLNMSMEAKCPECGFALNYERDESTEIWKCSNCGWEVATTYMDPIKLDETKYEILLSKNLSPKLNQLKVLSHISGSNVIQIKKMLESDNSLLFKGKATDVLKIKKQLEQEEIEFQIVPNFSY